jgi:ELWxxDGT repeat protein
LILIGEDYIDEYGNEIYISDGTENGTYLLKDIYFGSGSSNPYSFISFQSHLYFIANSYDYGSELWKTDGTSILSTS